MKNWFNLKILRHLFRFCVGISKKSSMHFALILDISLVHTNIDNVTSRAVATFSNRSYSNPITNYYIINVPGHFEYNNIVTSLTNISRETGLRFIVTPIMNGGTYNGMIDANNWTSINNISR